MQAAWSAGEPTPKHKVVETEKLDYGSSTWLRFAAAQVYRTSPPARDDRRAARRQSQDAQRAVSRRPVDVLLAKRAIDEENEIFAKALPGARRRTVE
jgi:hypothetical protein